jgi:competence protein ComGC
MNVCRRRNRATEAFTLTELLFVTAGIALFLLTTIPLLGNTKARTERSGCANNLRRIGVAFQSWADGHDDKLPWLVPSGSGGTAPTGISTFELAFVHFSALSNDLADVSALTCPSDIAPVPHSWGFGSDGFLNGQYRNNALSYLVGAHGESSLPYSVLSADRNIVPDSLGASCSIGFRSLAQTAPLNTTTRTGWSGTNLHGNFGNVLTGGGAVLELDSNGFKAVQRQTSTDNGSQHFLLPR